MNKSAHFLPNVCDRPKHPRYIHHIQFYYVRNEYFQCSAIYPLNLHQIQSKNFSIYPIPMSKLFPSKNQKIMKNDFMFVIR